MSSERTYVDYLRDIVEAAENAETFISTMDYDTFAEDTKTVYAVTRALEIIGEAAKRIPETIRLSHPEIPWRLMAGTRDQVIHGYFRVDLARVFETVRQDLPPMRGAVERLLDELEPSS
ncbi:MAG: DUF86 domain-containing protein [Anaerolineae bacterium]